MKAFFPLFKLKLSFKLMILMNNKIDNYEYERTFFDGKIHLINNDQDLSELSEKLLSITEFGFDTETRPSFKKGDNFKMALLQLSTPDEAFLIRLHFISQFEIIKKILENKKVLKVGLAIRDDIKGLQKIFPFHPEGFVELQELAKKIGLKNMGLKGMTEEVLQVTLSKRAKLTNWEQKSLTNEQLVYAATDAWIGLSIYQHLDKH
jgi:ribonuclease D